MLLKFLRLSKSQRSLFLQAFIFMLKLRLRLKLQSFSNFLAWFKTTRLKTLVNEVEFKELKLSVNRAAKFLVDPHKPCLPKALTAYKLCNAAGIQSSVRIGIMKEAEKFKAHAWLVINEEVVLGNLPNLEHYKELTRFEEL